MELVDEKQQLDYRAVEAVNQSALKELNKGPEAYLKSFEKDDKPTPDYFIFGSAVDCLLTTPDEFDSQFAVLSFSKPSDTICLIMENLHKQLLDVNTDPTYVNILDWEEFILSVASAVGYGGKWKPETVVNKIYEQGNDYFEFIAKAEGKEVIDLNTYTRVENCAKSILNDEFTSKLLTTNTLYQTAIYWENNGVDCKALLDAMNIDEKNKTIQPIDIKTTGDSVYFFPSSVFKFRYDIQAAFYTEALESAYPGYTILPFKFIVADKWCNNPPMIYACSKRDIEIGKVGLDLPSGKRLKGYKELMAELKWHQESGIWNYSKEYFLNGGEFNINIGGKENEEDSK